MQVLRLHFVSLRMTAFGRMRFAVLFQMIYWVRRAAMGSICEARLAGR
jgi:hypothetical protein